MANIIISVRAPREPKEEQKMTITKAEVKTIYDIEITKEEAFEIAKKASSDRRNYLETFKWVTDEKEEEFGRRFHTFNGLDANETRYLAEKLGFDGVVNHGFPKNGVWMMSVYRYGDRMN